MKLTSHQRWVFMDFHQTAKQSVFFSKSAKKSVKRGVRVLRAPSLRASHARSACEAREKKPYFQRLSPVSLYVFSLDPDLLFDCSPVLEYAKYGLFCSLDFHVQLLILFSYFEFFLASAPEEVKRVFSLENANQVQLTPDNSNLTLTRTSHYM